MVSESVGEPSSTQQPLPFTAPGGYLAPPEQAPAVQAVAVADMADGLGAAAGQSTGDGGTLAAGPAAAAPPDQDPAEQATANGFLGIGDAITGRRHQGGVSAARGVLFELRLCVKYCLYALLGPDARLEPGAIREVHYQAPPKVSPVDDLVVRFESGARWVFQAKAGISTKVGWRQGQPFADALRQLYSATVDANNTPARVNSAANSLDRLYLAVDHDADGSVARFGRVLDRARHTTSWHELEQSFRDDQDECAWLQQLRGLLRVSGAEVWQFLTHLYIEQLPRPEAWRLEMEKELYHMGVTDEDKEKVIGVLYSIVVDTPAHAATFHYKTLAHACRTVASLRGRDTPPIQFFETPEEAVLYEALRIPSDRPADFVPRPELDPAINSGQGLLLAGRPGSGKSHALIRLALAQPGLPAVVITDSFRFGDITRLRDVLCSAGVQCQILWDDIHKQPELFATTLRRLHELRRPVRVLAAYRATHLFDVSPHLTNLLLESAGMRADPLGLQAFDEGQAKAMAALVVKTHGLKLDAGTTDALARHIRQDEGGPYFAQCLGYALQEKQSRGEPVDAAAVDGLPPQLVDVWKHQYGELIRRFGTDSAQTTLLKAVRFLRLVGCAARVKLVSRLYDHVRNQHTGFGNSDQELIKEGWLRVEGDEYNSRDITLEAVPLEPGDIDFQNLEAFADADAPDEESIPMHGLLQEALTRYYEALSLSATTASGRQEAAGKARLMAARAADTRRKSGRPPADPGDLSNIAGLLYQNLISSGGQWSSVEPRPWQTQHLEQMLDATRRSVDHLQSAVQAAELSVGAVRQDALAAKQSADAAQQQAAAAKQAIDAARQDAVAAKQSADAAQQQAVTASQAIDAARQDVRAAKQAAEASKNQTDLVMVALRAIWNAIRDRLQIITSLVSPPAPSPRGARSGSLWARRAGQPLVLHALVLLIALAALVVTLIIHFSVGQRISAAIVPPATPALATPAPTPQPSPVAAAACGGNLYLDPYGQSCFQVVYDFVEQAEKTAWDFYTPSYYTGTFEQVSSYPPTYTLGGAWLITHTVTLESGERFARALETRPPYAPTAEIWGKYDLRNVAFQNGDRFFAQVGFLDGAYEGDVIFKVRFWSGDPQTPPETVGSFAAHYDRTPHAVNQTKTWQVTLPPGLKGGYFYLQVNSVSESLQDRAVWFVAQIRRSRW